MNIIINLAETQGKNPGQQSDILQHLELLEESPNESTSYLLWL